MEAKVKKRTSSSSPIKTQNSRGVALLFIVLITSLILAIGLGLTVLLIQGMRIMSEIGYSVVAFYAADNGIEEALYDLYQNPSPSPLHSGNLDSAYYETSAKCCHFSFVDKCSFGDPGNPEEDGRPTCPLGSENIGSNDPNNPDYCNTTKYCLKSRGSYQRVKRAIEINY